MEMWRTDPILGWQRIVIREYVPLRRVRADTGGKVPASFEFRTFWCRGECVGAGPYWSEFSDYDWTPEERNTALGIIAPLVKQIDAALLVVDIAQTEAGDWIVIELNSPQESGYAGVNPTRLWKNILDAL